MLVEFGLVLLARGWDLLGVGRTVRGDVSVLIRIERDSKVALHTQIRRQLQELILSGVLSPGTRLPSTRELACSLGVNRSTVVAAYRQLWSEGLVEGHRGGGTVVAQFEQIESAPKTQVQPLAWEKQYSRTFSPFDPVLLSDRPPLHEQDVIRFCPGNPPDDLFPVKALRNLAESISLEEMSSLRWGTAQGMIELRRAISERLVLEGIDAAPSQIIIVTCGQQGIYLIARALLQPGDTVVTEMPTYLGAQYVFQACEVRIASVPVSEEGLRLDILEGILKRQHPKLIFVSPTFHNPTTVTMPLEQRKELIALAHQHQVPILEYDPYSPFRYDGKPLPTLRALDTQNHVLYVFGATEKLFPGMRVAWLVAPPRVRQRLVPFKWVVDAGIGALGQWAVYKMLRSDQDRLKTLRARFTRRRDAMCEALSAHCKGLLRWKKPEGGFFVWAELEGGLLAERLLEEALVEGVRVIPGSDFFHEGVGGERHLRLDFAELSEDQITEGVRRLGVAIRRCAKKYGSRKSRS